MEFHARQTLLISPVVHNECTCVGVSKTNTNRIIAFECHRRYGTVCDTAGNNQRRTANNLFSIVFCGFSLASFFCPRTTDLLVCHSVAIALRYRCASPHCDTCQINYIEANLYCSRHWICQRNDCSTIFSVTLFVVCHRLRFAFDVKWNHPKIETTHWWLCVQTREYASALIHENWNYTSIRK